MGDETRGESSLQRADAPAMESETALGLALSSASREKADAFLDEQTRAVRMQREAGVAEKQARILDLQIQDLEREDVVRHWSLRVHHISDVMKLAFELAVAFIVLAVAFGIGSAIWSAAHDDSLVIEAFSVPPDMAQRGLTGQAIAAQLQDKLLAMQAATDSARPAESYANNWGNDIKVEIPNTGISISEFYRYLATWLGHQTHIHGEVYRQNDKIVIAAHAGGDSGTKVEGSEADLDKLLQQSAETIYRQTQPYRYAIYEEFHGNLDEAHGILEGLAQNGPTVLDRAWAFNGLGVVDGWRKDLGTASDEIRKATDLIPDFAIAWSNQDYFESARGHDEAALAAARTAARILEFGATSGGVEVTPRARAIGIAFERADAALYVNDFAQSLRWSEEAVKLPDYGGGVELNREDIVGDYALLHDPRAARRALLTLPPSDDLSTKLNRALTAFTIAYWLGDWQSVAQGAERVRTLYAQVESSAKLFQVFPLADVEQRQLRPYSAYALAASGDIAAAEALIANTPLDCFVCLRIRARIAAMHHDWRQADIWFARATGFAPSIPLGWSDWGAALLRRGDYDGAIAKFELAYQKGPHFADPLEMWGEALIAKNRSDLALEKFEEANKYAPRWGRLHLKWGEALLYLGRRDEARTQFAAAAALELSPSEKSQLLRARNTNG